MATRKSSAEEMFEAAPPIIKLTVGGIATIMKSVDGMVIPAASTKDRRELALEILAGVIRMAYWQVNGAQGAGTVEITVGDPSLPREEWVRGEFHEPTAEEQVEIDKLNLSPKIEGNA